MTWISGWLPGWEGSWFGPEEAAPAGSMTFYVTGHGTFTSTSRAQGFASASFTGAGSFSASAVAVAPIELAAGGTGSMSASVINGNAGPSFGDMTLSAAGTGSLAASFFREQADGGQVVFMLPTAAPKAKPIRRQVAVKAGGHSQVVFELAGAGLMQLHAVGSSDMAASIKGLWQPSNEEISVALFMALERAA